MAITRLAISNPAANTDTLMHTAVRSAVASVIATNKDTVSSIISIWIVPSGQDATPANWVHIASNLSIEAGNSVETFRFPIVGSDKIYIRSSTANVSFSLNALYEANGTSNITAQSTAPASPQIGDVWVDTDDNSVNFWSGSAWINATTELPSQTGNSGKYLTTNGTSVSWGTIDLSAKADLASPTFTGTPAAPTASVDTNTTQIATTAFVIGQAYKKEVSLAIDHTYSTTLASGYRYFVDTSTNSVSLTLPASPNLGNEIQVFDASDNASTNNITLNRNGVKINGGTENLLIDLDGGATALIYTGSTYGWKVA